MSPSGLEKKKAAASEFLYRQLVSTEKSEEYAIEFLRMELKKRKLNYQELRRFSDMFAEIIANKMESKDANILTDKEKQKITKESLRETFVLWRKENE